MQSSRIITIDYTRVYCVEYMPETFINVIYTRQPYSVRSHATFSNYEVICALSEPEIRNEERRDLLSSINNNDYFQIFGIHYVRV